MQGCNVFIYIVQSNDYQRYLQYFLDSIYDLLIGLYALKSRHIVCLVDRIQPSLIYLIISQHVTLEERRKKSSMYPSNEYCYYLFKNHIVQEIMLFMKSFKTSLVMVQWYYAKDMFYDSFHSKCHVEKEVYYISIFPISPININIRFDSKTLRLNYMIYFTSKILWFCIGIHFPCRHDIFLVSNTILSSSQHILP